MTLFQPVVPQGGLTGYLFLKRTMENQTAFFNKSPDLKLDTDYFKENIASVETVDDLMGDYRMLKVALGAFGLEDDIGNRYFIRQILEQGTKDDTALANKMSDDRYKKMSEAFGFDNFTSPNTQNPGFAAEIVDLFNRQQFEVAVGEQDTSLRLALNAEHALVEVAQDDSSERVKWFSIMGNTPLREVMETALGLPSSFGQMDIDKQVEVFSDRARSQLGLESLSDLADDEVRAGVIQRFLLMDQVQSFNSGMSSGSIALTLLQGG